MRTSVAGPLAASDAGGGTWQLSSTAPGPEVQIFLRGAGASATPRLTAATIDRVVLEWQRDAVRVTLSAAGTVTALSARSAIVHEAQNSLYQCLPLADFDADARAFWKRVFRLMRIPGGRFLLGFMTRRGRRSR